jgi:hypothetical protein
MIFPGGGAMNPMHGFTFPQEVQEQKRLEFMKQIRLFAG